MQDKNRNGDDVKQREQHADFFYVYIIIDAFGDYDVFLDKSLVNKTHRQIECLDVLGQGANRDTSTPLS